MRWLCFLLFVLSTGRAATSQEGVGDAVRLAPDAVLPAGYFSFGDGDVSGEVAFSIAVVRDPYHGRDWNVSASGAIVAGASLLGYVADHYRGAGPRSVIRQVALAPMLLNGQVNYNMLRKELSGGKSFVLGPFLGHRTDLFVLHSPAWVRYAPEAGLRLYRGAWAEDDKGWRGWRGIGLEVGLSFPYDIAPGPDDWGRPLAFVGIRLLSD